MRIARSATLALAFGLMLGAAGGHAAETGAAETPRHGGILNFAVTAEPANYDCEANVSFAFIHPIAPHYSTLLKFDPVHYPAIEGDLAKAWSVSPDKKVYTFKLQPHVLFHDGTVLSSADVKASYERIIHPAKGVFSARQADYASIAEIDTPDPLTVVFHLSYAQSGMLENFASPWNCIYSAAKLKADPLYPSQHVMGTGPFVFVEHVKGDHWTGRRFAHYFRPGHPYLDGYTAHFMSGSKVVSAFKSGAIEAEFRSVTPVQRDQLTAALGDRVDISESPWVINLLLIFNTKHKPFDDMRVRQALSLAIDRWQMAKELSGTTYMKYVGGLMRPGFSMATPEAELERLPGFSHDAAASEAEARRLLAEAGVHNLTVAFVNRSIPVPYGPAADYVTAAWKRLGVTVKEVRLDNKHWDEALKAGAFDAAFDFDGDYMDDPTLQMTKYVSPDLSPDNYSGATDRMLDALFVGQAVIPDPRERARIVRSFEKRAMTEAYSVPILWWNRIIAHSSRLHGWTITPSHYLEQDLGDVWLDAPGQKAPTTRAAER
ncbi:MAG TPA: ABC transporter substrate-binding protein [Stellaceae bacterium]|nr:ABC transporter substrate-binding protein [Stellaceae bacterium]